MKLKLVLGVVLVMAVLSLVSIVAASAADVPAPYAGMKNPFSWNDMSAHQAGQKVYQQNCIGCHGVAGGNLPTAKFNDNAFPKNLEGGADFYFWTLSEGRMAKGMPPFKGSLSDQQRWQVLTYLWTLSASAAPPPAATPTVAAAPQGTYTIDLSAPSQAVAGEAVTLTATVKDSSQAPVSKAVIKFQQQVDFFTTGMVDIGEATTDNIGKAQLSYTPRSTGKVTYAAVYNGDKASAVVNTADPSAPLYETSVGVKFPSAGPAVFLGPSVSAQISYDAAPAKVFRLPGGLFSMLWIPICVIALIWFTYFRVMYQVLHISPKRDEMSAEQTNTRVLPTIGLVIIVCMGLLLLSMFAAGPYSQWHVFTQ